MTTGTVLILGGSGRIGRHATRAFDAAGWTVRGFDRARDDLLTAATGADVIVMGAHPPSYDLWADQLLPLHASVIAAAEATGATVIVPGNVYAFGPDAPAPWGPASPQTARNPLGLLRIEMERMYRRSQARTVFLYCGDFIDDTPSGGWFDRFVTPRIDRGILSWPGDPEAMHAWAYLPDVARIMVALAGQRAALDRFEPVPVPGFTLSGRQMGQEIARTLGRDVRVGRMGWWWLHLLRPVMPVLSGVFEMRYLWSLPHRLDTSGMDRLLPGFRPTPVQAALAAALAHKGASPVTQPLRPGERLA